MLALSPTPSEAARPTAYSYIRFSDAKQLRGDSLRRQLERSRAYADRHGLKLDESTTIRDLGVSAFRGANRQTGALGAFLQAVDSGKIAPGAFLLVESFDRLSREKPLVALEPFIGLINAGITVVTLIDEVVHSREKYDHEWTGLIVSLAKMAQANEESAKKSDRLSELWKDKHAKTAHGVIATAKCPGWLRKEGGEFVLIHERVMVVRRIFEEFVGGTGRGTIALRLNREGIASFGHGQGWHGGTIQKITTNPAVIGHYTPHTVRREVATGPDGKPMMREKRIPVGPTNTTYYPQAIPPELFYRAQLVAKERSVVPGNAGGRKGTVFSNLFSGLATCANCKRRMNYVDRGVRSTVVLRCSGERTGTCTNSARVPYKALEEAVLDWVQELDLGETRSDEAAQVEGRIASLTAERDRITRIAHNLIEQFEGASRLVKEQVLRHENAIEAIEGEIAASKLRLEQIKGAVPASERRAQVAALRARMADASGPALYAIRAALAQSLREIVKVMIFHRSGRVHCVLKAAEKQYFFIPASDRSTARFTVDAVKLFIRPDAEMSADQRAMFDLHASVLPELEGNRALLSEEGASRSSIKVPKATPTVLSEVNDRTGDRAEESEDHAATSS